MVLGKQILFNNKYKYSIKIKKYKNIKILGFLNLSTFELDHGFFAVLLKEETGYFPPGLSEDS